MCVCVYVCVNIHTTYIHTYIHVCVHHRCMFGVWYDTMCVWVDTYVAIPIYICHVSILFYVCIPIRVILYLSWSWFVHLLCAIDLLYYISTTITTTFMTPCDTMCVFLSLSLSLSLSLCCVCVCVCLCLMYVRVCVDRVFYRSCVGRQLESRCFCCH